MKKKKILVTGAAGFIGTNLVLELAKKGHKILALDTKRTDKFKHLKNVSFIGWDVRESLDWLPKVDEIYHLAAVVGVDYVAKHPIETMDTEMLGIINVGRYAVKKSIRKILFSSTSAVYGDTKNIPANEGWVLRPLHGYGVAKSAAETYLKSLKEENDVDYVVLRYFNVYGKFQDDKMVAARFLDQARKNKPLTVFGDGTQTRDFLYIKDAITATIKAMESKNGNSKIFNLGYGEEIKIKDVAKLIIKVTKSKAKIKFVPVKKYRAGYEIMSRLCDNSRIKKDLKFKFKYDLEKGLKDWIKDEIPKIFDSPKLQKAFEEMRKAAKKERIIGKKLFY